MISIISKPNTDGASADYPRGKIRDNDGTGNGTPVNTVVYGDYHQFFAKLMADASISPNDLPENVSNTFQLNLALAAVIKLLIDDNQIAYITTGVSYSNSGSAASGFGFKKTLRNTIKIAGAINLGVGASYSSFITYMTLPVGYRPSIKKIKAVTLRATGAGSNQTVGVIIDTNGTVQIDDSGNPGAATGGPYELRFDNLEFDL